MFFSDVLGKNFNTTQQIHSKRPKKNFFFFGAHSDQLKASRFHLQALAITQNPSLPPKFRSMVIAPRLRPATDLSLYIQIQQTFFNQELAVVA
jgi:hypothetical protein